MIYNKNIDKLAEHFEINNKDLYNILHRTGGEIMGGCLLPLYLNENFYEDQDLDIFVKLPYESKYNDHPNIYNPNMDHPTHMMARYEFLMLSYIDKILKNNNFTIFSTEGQILNWSEKLFFDSYAKYQETPVGIYLKHVLTYQKNNKKIQIIILFNCDTEDLLKLFDLSICKLHLDTSKINNTLTQYIDETTQNEIKNKLMRSIISKHENTHREIRIEKYIKRGFTLINN
jgi:hypothetical protein